MAADTTRDDVGAHSFIFVTCQIGAEAALKREMSRRWPDFHLAFSRPGFITFKLPPESPSRDVLDLGCVFARAHGYALEKISAERLEDRADQVARAAGERAYQALHVWQRDTARIGYRGFEPHLTEAALEAEAAVRSRWPAEGASRGKLPARIAKPGDLVLDCVLVEPELWWTGWHRAGDDDSCFAGGLREITLPADAISRAWLKMEEALAWSRLPIRPGQRIAELGCAPGGASQALLAHGLKVLGIDPAQVDGRLLANPNFEHVQKRAGDVRRRDFRGVTWLTADMNVAPDATLDTVEAIVTHESTNVRGLLLTLKLLDWSLADQIDAYLDRIRRWGYRQVRARQLAHNRQEICVAASGRRAARRKHR